MGEIRRDEGVRSLWFKLLGELGYRRVALFEASPDSVSLPVRPPEVSLSLVGLADAEDCAGLQPSMTPERIRRRIESGQVGMGARVEGRLAAVAWAGQGACGLGYVHVPVVLGPMAAMLEVYTHPDLRGRGLATAVCAALLVELQARGVARSLAAIVPENAPSIRVFTRLGHRKIGVVRAIRLGAYRRTLVPRRCGLEAGPPAPLPKR